MGIGAQKVLGQDNQLVSAMKSIRSAFVGAGLFSMAVNLLMLTGPIFMLQVYDRVLTSRSVPTLVALIVLAAALYLFLGFFEFFRTRVLSRAGYWLDQQLGGLTFDTWISQGTAFNQVSGRPIQDLSVVRTFLGSPGLIGMFDMPWIPFYLAIVFIIHPLLGWLAVAGALIVVAIALINERLTREPFGKAAGLEGAEARFSEQAHRNAEMVLAMGMLGNLKASWQSLHNETTERAQAGGERAEVFAASSKAFRLLLQSGILALGGWLAIYQEISPGMIVAASIIAGRALAPVDQVIGHWRNIVRARQSYARLKTHLDQAENGGAQIDLPEPKGHIQLIGVSKFVPSNAPEDAGGRRLILKQVSFSLAPGDALGIIGQSASGKSTLARLMVGAWTPDSGTVRLDGAPLDQWDNERLGKYIGYLPQSMELIAGTLKQNIARFAPDADDSLVIDAAKLAGVHEMILRLPEGYATQIGFGALPLSGGQIQRIALARAVYGMPKLVVLDEPNSNLDADGEQALAVAITQLRKAGSVVVVVAHRPSAVAAVNKLLMLANGGVVEFGEKDEVLRKVTRPAGK